MTIWGTLELLIENIRGIESVKISHVLVRPDVAAFLFEIRARHALGKPNTKRSLRRMRGRARLAMKKA